MKSSKAKNATKSRVQQSMELYEEAKVLIPKVTQLLSRHPEMQALGISPIYAERAKGCRFWDVDGNEYIDTMGGTGVIGIGYCVDEIDQAAKDDSWSQHG